MEKQIKGVRIFLIIYGGVMTIIPLFYLFSLVIVRFLFNNPMKGEIIWIIFMPILAIIGIMFLLTGLLIKKIKKRRLLIHIIISFFPIIWMVLYTIISFNCNHFPNKSEGEINYILARVFGYGAMVMVFLLFLVPEIIIGFKLYKIQKINRLEG
jgi:hypothetical protein